MPVVTYQLTHAASYMHPVDQSDVSTTSGTFRISLSLQMVLFYNSKTSVLYLNVQIIQRKFVIIDELCDILRL